MAKLNNKQLKKLYDYGGTLSPKDWGDMVDSLRQDYTEKAPVVKTTYETARDLYNSGQMIPGVKYAFTYHHAFDWIQDDYVNMQVRNNIDIQVYIDNNGNLKADGFYNLTGVDRYFTSDYTFNPTYVIFHKTDVDTEYIESYVDYYKPIMVGIYYVMDASDITSLVDYLNEKNISYDYDYDADYDSHNILKFNSNVCINDYVIDDENLETILIFEDGAIFNISDYRYGDEVYISRLENINIQEGYLYNLNFGTHKHSHVVEAVMFDCIDETNDSPTTVNANVINDHFIPYYGIVNIENGTMINTHIDYVHHRSEDSPQSPTLIEIENIYTINNNLTIETGESVTYPYGPIDIIVTGTYNYEDINIGATIELSYE